MKNTVTNEEIERLIAEADVEVETKFDKTTTVYVRLKNGFVLQESSSCVDPANYNEEIGISICLDRIKNKLWELEGYRLQWEVFDR